MIEAQSEIEKTHFNLKSQVIGLVGWLAISVVVMVLGGLATASSVTSWFRQLEKPVWNPPDWIFGPVWTVLYLMMGVAAWLVWKKAGWKDAHNALSVYLLQLFLNLSWSLIFFGLRQPGLAFPEIVILWLAILLTTIMFWQKSKLAGLLLIPYLLWVTFASCLNLAIWQLNS